MPGAQTSRSDPVCGTCRRKSRKCDRTKPQCRRCLSKGLLCEGYETKFKIYDVNSGSKRKKAVASKDPPEAWQPLATSNTSETGNASEPEAAFLPDVVPDTIPLEVPHLTPIQATQDIPTPSISFSPFTVSNHSRRDASSLLSPPSIEEDEAQLAHRQALSKDDARTLLAHFESICSEIIATLPGSDANPFQLYMIPLAYEHSSLLHALLGFAASHISPSEFPQQATIAIEHRLLSIQALGSLLIKEQCLGLASVEEDITLSIVLLLLLQDICESGVSSHGAHLNGVAFLCSRMTSGAEPLSPLRRFLVAALSWFDLLRGMSGAEKLAFPSGVRNHVSESTTFDLEALTGCPKSIFEIMGRVLMHGKSWLAGEATEEAFRAVVDRSERALRRWDPSHETYPNDDPNWPLLAEAYRHMALLRIIRFPDPFNLPNTDENVRVSVQRILDISSQISWKSPFYKRMLFPIFYAGTDTEHRYQHHYVQVCLEEITRTTGFHQPALLQLLQLVWQERAESDGTQNVPWTEYTCSKSLRRQHDYLFF